MCFFIFFSGILFAATDNSAAVECLDVLGQQQQQQGWHSTITQTKNI